MADELSDWVQAASQQEAACAAVHALYDRLDQQIRQRTPICTASGECCHFDAYGHRLYVTTLELGTFVRDSRTATREAAPPASRSLPQWVEHDPGGCTYQVAGLCSVHAIRPFGCRIFFCDPSATQWQQELYERFHAELKQLHISFEIPYAYVEWRGALQTIGSTEIRMTKPEL